MAVENYPALSDFKPPLSHFARQKEQVWQEMNISSKQLNRIKGNINEVKHFVQSLLDLSYFTTYFTKEFWKKVFNIWPSDRVKPYKKKINFKEGNF